LQTVIFSEANVFSELDPTVTNVPVPDMLQPDKTKGKKEEEVSRPVAVKHEAHFGFNKGEGKFTSFGLPPLLQQLFNNLDFTLKEMGVEVWFTVLPPPNLCFQMFTRDIPGIDSKRSYAVTSCASLPSTSWRRISSFSSLTCCSTGTISVGVSFERWYQRCC
jgi:hypothetical protein